MTAPEPAPDENEDRLAQIAKTHMEGWLISWEAAELLIKENARLCAQVAAQQKVLAQYADRRTEGKSR